MELVMLYIESKQLAWSKTTIVSENARLRNIPDEIILTNNVSLLYLHLRDTVQMRPYSIKTTLVRVSAFRKWAASCGYIDGVTGNAVAQFMQTHANLFKNAYIEKLPDVSFEEAIRRIDTITDSDVQAKARQLLTTGMRWSESATLRRGLVVGKGGKTRQVTKPDAPAVEYTKSKSWFNRCLRNVGLTPHMLRKIHATKRVELGTDPLSLAAQMGWSSVNTAMKYVQGSRNTEISDAIAVIAEG